jgi:hypothetical protein
VVFQFVPMPGAAQGPKGCPLFCIGSVRYIPGSEAGCRVSRRSAPSSSRLLNFGPFGPVLWVWKSVQSPTGVRRGRREAVQLECPGRLVATLVPGREA